MISIQELRKREREQLEETMLLNGYDDSGNGALNINPSAVPADTPPTGILKFARFIKR